MQCLLRAALRAAIVCVACAAVAAQAQNPLKSLLWQVKSRDNTVYLYGTIHVGKPSFYPLPDAVENAFRQSARLAVEADVTDEVAMAAVMPLLRYTPPDSLDTRLAKPILERLRTQLAHYGIPYDGLRQMRPFMAGGLLSVAEFTRLGYDHRFGLDGYFIEKAILGGKPVLELESVEQQMRMLNSLSSAEQEAFLANTLTALESGKAAEQVAGMFNAWRSGNAALLEEGVKKASEGMAMTEVLDEKMLYGRNPAMLSKIEIFLAGKQVHFVAIGALHLIGKRGLVEMLKTKGYEITQL
jgi:Uncharacterized protein conserved in bacteria